MIKNMKIISLKIIILFFILTKCIFANDINSVEIISDELEWNEKEKIAYARGNASAEQKDKKLTADELIVHLSKDNKNTKNNNEIVMIEAIGNVTFSSKEDKATGNNAVYNIVKNNIIIDGNVILKRKENIMQGEHLEMDLNTGVSSISNGKEGEKVRMLFSTKNDGETITDDSE
mgnify:FL=1